MSDHRRIMRPADFALLAAVTCLLGSHEARLLAEEIEFRSIDAELNVVPCRVRIRDSENKPHRPDGHPFWRGQFTCRGEMKLNLPPGTYSYTVERGPEFERVRGTLEVKPKVTQKLTVLLRRVAHLRKEGWYSGDLHIHRPFEEVELLAHAEDLDFAPVITWWNGRNPWRDQPLPQPTERRFGGHRIYTITAGEDEREGGALLYFGLPMPIDITSATKEYPSPLTYVDEARKKTPGAWIDIEKPFWWDAPTWLASGKINSIGIANNHMCYEGMLENEAWGRARDAKRLPPPRGNGFWTQEIYYHALNCGLRIPPSAGSASGVLPNPVGYNRVYVYLDERFSQAAWWNGLRAGRCFVTNGPLLRVTAGGHSPGHVIRSPKPLTVPVEVLLTTQDPVPQIEVVMNGKVIRQDESNVTPSHRHGFDLEIKESGWFLLRAITNNDDTFRFASTGPFYVEIGEDQTRVSRASAEFFEKWVEERIERVKKNLPDAKKQKEVLTHHLRAREFWQNKVKAATAP